MHTILKSWTNTIDLALIWCNGFSQKNVVSTVLDIHLCSWTLMLLHSSFFLMTSVIVGCWQEDACVPGANKSVVGEHFSLPLGLFTRLVISVASHQASPDYSMQLYGKPTEKTFCRGYTQHRVTVTMSNSRALLFCTQVQHGCKFLMCGVHASVVI